MRVRKVDTTKADQESAQIFFDQLFRVYDLAKARVLDAFSRNGQLTVASYIQYLEDPRSQLFCWELCSDHQKDLFTYTDNVEIGCSYVRIKREIIARSKYDVLVIDTPQGLHKSFDSIVHSEHWDFLGESIPLLADTGIIVLYVNKRPYNREEVGSYGYDEYDEYDFKQWMVRRSQFYNFVSNREEDYVRRYREFMMEHGLIVKSMVIAPCFSDVVGIPPYSFRLGLEVVR